VFQELCVVGRCGILTDFANPPTDRPYLAVYRAEAIINWDWIVVEGERILTLVVLREAVTEPDPSDPFVPIVVPQYRVLRLLSVADTQQTVVEIWRQAETKERGTPDWYVWSRVTPMRRGQPLDFLPFVFLPDIDLTKPPLLDLVNANLSHYRTSADREWGLHFTALPTPWAKGVPTDARLPIGSGEAWILDKDGDAGMLEFTGAGLGALQLAAEDKKREMAVLGARMLEEQPNVQDTATAVIQRNAGEMSVLKYLALRASTGLTLTLQWMAWWAGATEEPQDEQFTAALNTDFVPMPLSSDEFNALINAYSQNAISFEVYWYQLVKGEMIPPGWTKEDEQGAQTKMADEKSERLIKETRAIEGTEEEEEPTIPAFGGRRR
jgi:hypothetical protein